MVMDTQKDIADLVARLSELEKQHILVLDVLINLRMEYSALLLAIREHKSPVREHLLDSLYSLETFLNLQFGQNHIDRDAKAKEETGMMVDAVERLIKQLKHPLSFSELQEMASRSDRNTL